MSKTEPIYKRFKAAGCIFTDNKHVLAGYHPNKTVAYISGFGGKREGSELFGDTAIRETIEELFEIKDISRDLLQDVVRSITPKNVLVNGDYINIVFTFGDLIDLMCIVRDHVSDVDIYPNGFPRTLQELIFTREAKDNSEISHLCILPISKNIRVDSLFIKDINILVAAPK